MLTFVNIVVLFRYQFAAVPFDFVCYLHGPNEYERHAVSWLCARPDIVAPFEARHLLRLSKHAKLVKLVGGTEYGAYDERSESHGRLCCQR